MSPSVPLVEDRLRHIVASLESLHRLAAFSSQPHEIPLYADLPAFANTVASFTRAVQVHVGALTAALPERCRSIAAPGQDEIALPPFDRFPAYLQSDQREVFDRLDKQVRAFGVLTSALDTYVNDVPYSSGEMLSDMAALARAQAQSTLRSMDEIAALALRITAEAQARALKRSLEAQQPTPPILDENGGSQGGAR